MKTIKILFGSLLLSSMIISCSKDDPAPVVVTPNVTSMKITALRLDSAVQISNPMSFLIKATSAGGDNQTSVYDLPMSSSSVYPAGNWTNLGFSFGVTNSVTLKVYFKLPGSPVEQELVDGTFTFTPSSLLGTGTNASNPTTKTWVGNPGPDETKLTATLAWQ